MRAIYASLKFNDALQLQMTVLFYCKSDEMIFSEKLIEFEGF